MTGNNRGHAVKLTTETKKKLEAVRDLLEEAIQEQFSQGLAPGVRPPKISQSYAISASLDMMAGVIVDSIEVYPAGAVGLLMAQAGRLVGNGVLSAMGEHTARVELEDGKPYLIRPSSDPIEILIQLPDAAAAAAAQPPMAEA